MPRVGRSQGDGRCHRGIHPRRDIYAQEVFTDGGKNLWGGAVQKYLSKIGTFHKGTSPYHPRTNGKVERLNGVIGTMLGKMLLNKPTKLWDLYLVRMSDTDPFDL